MQSIVYGFAQYCALESVTASVHAVLIAGNSRGIVACNFEPMVGGGMKIVLMIVGKVSLLGKRKEERILLQIRKWAEAFKITFKK